MDVTEERLLLTKCMFSQRHELFPGMLYVMSEIMADSWHLRRNVWRSLINLIREIKVRESKQC